MDKYECPWEMANIPGPRQARVLTPKVAAAKDIGETALNRRLIVAVR